MIKFIAEKEIKLSRLAPNYGVSYSALQKSLRKKDVKINGKRVNKDVMLNSGDIVEIYVQLKQVEFPIIFQDENVLLIDKPTGITSDEVYNNLNEDNNLYYIHRLDRNTSGLMIFAKNKESEEELLSGFKNRNFQKKYLARIYKKPQKTSDVLTAYLVKDSEKGIVKIYSEKVKDSVKIQTEYTLLKEYGDDTCLVEVDLITGKTHQIRAHLAHIGHFVIGDGKYGKEKINRLYGASKQQLRAYKLTLKFTEKDKLYYLNGKTFVLDGDFNK